MFNFRAVAQPGSAPRSGRGGRWFESSHPDRMAYFVYVLQSLKDGRYYIGVTSNIKKRLEFHNSGKQRSTKKRIPFKLIYFEECVDKLAALRREKQIKSFKGGEAFTKLIGGM